MKNNPYVGPRPYERGERRNFYGRDRDARDLIGIILSEQVTLFYAQSGAGKTSLLNAQVIPMLEERGLHVFPVARVSSDLPSTIPAQAVANIFVFSVLLGLAGPDVAPESLQDHTLLSFMQQAVHDPELHPPVIILDQFEELFATHRDRWQEAGAFLEQVRELADAMPRLGVVLAMREDHVAELDAYARVLPVQLRARLRMERLGPEAALEAVTKPALAAGCPFAPGVAERLVDDLRRIKVQQAGQDTPVLGPFVEPVQLQVVCQRLWAALPDQEDYAIQWEDVERHGDIDRALIGFYEDVVETTIRETGVSDRQLRRWVGTQLITPVPTRGLVLRTEVDTAGLPNAAVDVLEGKHLIRAEMRAGARWYELVHDRLVDPILQSNAAWDVARETPLRITARRWKETGADALLYRDMVLAEAQAWLAVHAEIAEPYEAEFLAASQAVQDARLAARRRRQRVLVGLSVFLVLLAVVTLWALRQRQIAVARQLAAQAQITLDNTKEGIVRSVLLATESLRRMPSVEADHVLHRGLERLPASSASVQHSSGVVWAVAISPDGQWVATAGSDRYVRIWDAAGEEAADPLWHFGDALALAFSPDGRWLATGSGDGSARLWSTATWQEAARFYLDAAVHTVAFNETDEGLVLAAGGTDGVVLVWDVATQQLVLEVQSGPPVSSEVEMMPLRPACDLVATDLFSYTFQANFEDRLAHNLAFSPEGNWLVTIGRDNVLQVWDTVLWAVIARLPQEDSVSALAFSPDGRWLATGSRDHFARVWRTGDWELAAQLEHECPLRAVVFGPDGQQLATASDDKTARLWDTATWDSVAQFAHSGAVWTVAFSPDGKWLATGGLDATARLWNLQTRLEITRMGHSQAVWAVAFAPGGDWLVTAGWDTGAWFWKVSQRQSTPVIRHGGVVVDVAFSPNGQWFASAGWDGVINVWQTTAGLAVNSLHYGDPANPYIPQQVWDIAFSPDGRRLAGGCGDGHVRVWDVVLGDILLEMQQGEDFDTILTVAYSADGQWIASGSRLTARIWDAETGREVARFRQGAQVQDVAFSPDGQWLATAGIDGTARVWEIATGQEIARFDHAGAVWAVKFSPDGKWIATASEDWTARLWDVENKSELIWWGHEAYVHDVAFSPDGHRLAAASLDGTATVWNTLLLRTRRPVARLDHEKDGVWMVVFSPDGKWLATATTSGTARVWDVSSGEEVARVAHGNLVNTITFGPDGRWLATGSSDATARVWNWRSADVVDEACNRLPRNLTREEWKRYLPGSLYRRTCSNLPVPEE
ncbi:MAG: eIF2A-related protein [Anaerolineae bacterium]